MSGRRLVRPRRGNVEVSPIPQNVVADGRARVHREIGAAPGLRRRVEAVDLVLRVRRVPQHAPPGAVVEPELALGLFGGRSGDARAIREVAITREGSRCLRAWNGTGGEADDQCQGEDRCPNPCRRTHPVNGAPTGLQARPVGAPQTH